MNDFLLHKEYIEVKGKYTPKFYNVSFTSKEIEFLENWYYWVDGLINGEIPPPLMRNRKHLKHYSIVQ